MTSSYLARVDFMDLKDALCILSDMLTGFRPIHVGLRYGGHYLTVNTDKPSEWHLVETADKVISPYIKHSFSIDPPDHDPLMIAMLGEGWIADSKTKLFMTEWIHIGMDLGKYTCKPRRTTCVGTAATLLNHMGLPIESTTSLGLFNELTKLASNTKYVRKTL